MRNQNYIVLMLFLLATFGLTTSLKGYKYDSTRENAYANAVDRAAASLRVERQKLELEKKELQKRYDRELQGPGINMIVFTELDEKLYTEVYPMMEEWGFHGVLALSDTQFPGKEGCITKDNYQEMREKGWSACIQWDTHIEWQEYIKEMEKLLKNIGEELPKTIYFQKNTYSDTRDPELEKAGFEIVVIHGEGGYPLINRSEETGLWHINSLSWNRTGIRAYVAKIASIGGAFAMNVDFGEKRSGYDAAVFNNMCAYMEALDNYQIQDFETARKTRSEIRVNEDLRREIEWYEGEISQINSEIQYIYEKN